MEISGCILSIGSSGNSNTFDISSQIIHSLMADTDGRIKLLNFSDKYWCMGILNTFVQEPLKHSLWSNILPEIGDPLARWTNLFRVDVALLDQAVNIIYADRILRDDWRLAKSRYDVPGFIYLLAIVRHAKYCGRNVKTRSIYL